MTDEEIKFLNKFYWWCFTQTWPEKKIIDVHKYCCIETVPQLFFSVIPAKPVPAEAGSGNPGSQ